MFVGELPSTRQLERVHVPLFNELAQAMDKVEPGRQVLRFDLMADFESKDDQFSKVAAVLGEMINQVTDSAFVSSIKTIGGRAIVKSGMVEPGQRQDSKNWHIDARGAVVASTGPGTQALEGDSTDLDPISAEWLEDIFSRHEVRFHPYDSQLQNKGLQPVDLEPNCWHEIPQYAVHRAPQNNTGQPVHRVFASVTPFYFLG